jgi:hypothetical protein
VSLVLFARPRLFGPLGALTPPDGARGVNPASDKKRGHAAYAASSPVFRAPKASLVQTKCPSAPAVLDGFLPISLGFRSHLPKTFTRSVVKRQFTSPDQGCNSVRLETGFVFRIHILLDLILFPLYLAPRPMRGRPSRRT